MPITKVTEASSEPVSLSEAKAHLRVDHTDDDTLIGALITAARQDAEARMGRTLLPTSWKLELDAFPAGRCIRLHWPVVTAVTSVKYRDPAGVQETWDPANYQLDATSEPARLCLAPDADWPDTQDDRVNAVEILYTAGWANAAAVPGVIKAWIKLRLGTLYEHRAEVSAGMPISQIPFVDHLLDPYRVWSLSP